MEMINQYIDKSITLAQIELVLDLLFISAVCFIYVAKLNVDNCPFV